MFRRGLRCLPEAAGRFDIVAEAGDGEGAVSEAERTQPDLVLLDIRMAGFGGLAERVPAAEVVILTEADTPQHRAEALAVGCRGYVPKSGDPDLLAETIPKTLMST